MRTLRKTGLMVFATASVFGWEINTHRAIERVAIEQSVNGGAV